MLAGADVSKYDAIKKSPLSLISNISTLKQKESFLEWYNWKSSKENENENSLS